MSKASASVSHMNPAPYGRWIATVHLTRLTDGKFRLTLVDMAKHEIESRGESHEILEWLAEMIEAAVPDLKEQAESLK